jgi:competence protein ComEA
MLRLNRGPVLIALVLTAVLALGAGAADKPLIDLNTASQKDLESLKGVGEATAKKIVAGRPYKTVDDLEKAGVSKRTINAIKPFVTVGGGAPAASSDAKATKGSREKKPDLVNINTADDKTLASLPGVGKATAQAIAKARPFKSVDDLEKVKGIGPKKYAKLKDLVTIGEDKSSMKTASGGAAPAATVPPAPTAASSGPAKPVASSGEKSSSFGMKLAPGQKVNINTASKDLLDALPGIGPVKAQAIIDGRPYNSIEDIMKVKGIKEGEFGKIKDLITVR